MKVYSSLLLALQLSDRCLAQSPGHGVAKSTYAVSNTKTSLAWIEKYLPVEEASGCPNNICKCGTQGRVQLSTADGSKGFGLHMVWAPGQDNQRANANGGWSVKQVESIVAEGIGQLSETYSSSANARGWTDNAVTLRASSGLDSYVQAFKEGGENYITGTVQTGKTTTYAVLVNIPSTTVILELQSSSCSSCSEQSLGARAATELGGDAAAPNSAKVLQPVKVSRAVTSVQAVIDFYKAVFLVDPASSTTDADGTKIVAFIVEEGLTTVLLQFVERPGQTGKHTSQWFATFQDTTNRKYMGTSYKGCWDIWGDNHVALDQLSSSMDVYWPRLKKAGYPLWMHSTPGGVHMYAQDPSGWQIQFDGTFNNPPSDVWPRAQQNCYVCCAGLGDNSTMAV
jgi:hypothetical protein